MKTASGQQGCEHARRTCWRKRIDVEIEFPLDVLGESRTLKRKLTATTAHITKDGKKLKSWKAA